MESAVSERGIVAAPHRAALATGAAVLAERGTAFEAAVAMAATLAVVYPHWNGIGGDSIWVVRQENGRIIAVQACGAAGAKAVLRDYRDRGHGRMPARGPDAAASVAGTISGWQTMLEGAAAAGGKMPLPVLLGDAIRLAREGVAVSSAQARHAPSADVLAAPGFAAHFLADDGKPLAEGALLVQARLADTLEHMSRLGLDDFYRGDVSREIAADLHRIGAPVTRGDLGQQRARVREPLRLRLREATMFVPPPPSQATAELLILGMTERLNLRDPQDVAFVHGLVEATKRAYTIRDRIVGDPADGLPDPRTFLTDAALDAEAASIDMQRAGPYPARGDGDTVWFGAVDARGRAVSVCQSLAAEWGSGCVLPATGILWHNRAGAFSLEPGSIRALRPGRLPYHTLAPALAEFTDGRVLALGTRGGDSQPQTVTSLYTRYARFREPLERAIAAPRWRFGKEPGEAEATLKIEPRFESGLVSALIRMGHHVEELPSPFSDEVGHAGMIVRHPSGRIEGVHDPRGDGGAAA